MSEKKQKVLLADDEPNIRILGEKLLKEAGYDVVLAADGIEAISKAISEKPDMVITDIRMPDVDVNHLLGYLSLHFPKMPVIVATAYPEYENLVKKNGNTVKAYFQKPFDFEKLKETIRRILPNAGGMPD